MGISWLACLALVIPEALEAADGSAPSLALTLLTGLQLRLAWPLRASSFWLESSPTLDPAQWQPVLEPPVVSGDQFVVTLPAAGQARYFRLRDTGLTTVSQTSPFDGESGVAVTRETIVRFNRPLAADTLLTRERFYAVIGNRRVLSRAELATDRRTATLFYLEPLPGSARVTVVLDGTGLLDGLGQPLDLDGDAQPGGQARVTFETLSTTALPNTAVVGTVYASELMPGPNPGSPPLNRPLAGVTITVDGREQELRTVTDASGGFRLEPVPPGRFFVHIDGRTVTDPGAGIHYPDQAYYPAVGKAWEAVAGRTNNLAGGTGTIFLPLIAGGTLQPVSATGDTTITFPASVTAGHPELAGVSITVPANSLFSDDGTRGGRVGIAPVPPDRLPGPLPPGLEMPIVITVQTDGPLNFDRPAPVCFPNLPDPVLGTPLPPGSRQALVSFNHRKGVWEAVGDMTVSADGKTICTDPGFGILQPGWHGVNPKPKKPDPCDPKKQCCDKMPIGAGAASLQSARLHEAGQPLECGIRCFPDREEEDRCLRVCEQDYRECLEEADRMMAYILDICDAIFATYHDKKRKSECYDSAYSHWQALRSECLRDKKVCSNFCRQCFGRNATIAGIEPHRQPVLNSAGATPTGLAQSPAEVEAQLAQILQTIADLIEPYATAPAEIPDPVFEQITALRAAADTITGGDALGFLAGRVAASDRARWNLGRVYARDYGDAPAYPIPYVATVVRPGGTLVIRSLTEPFGNYALFVPRDGELADVRFYDPSTRRYASVTPRLDPGLSDWLPRFSLAPLAPDELDTDHDGLPDVAEYVYGSDPTNADSDGDGIMDGVEVDQDTNPLDGSPALTGIIATTKTPGPAVDVAVAGRLAYVAMSAQGVAIFNLAPGQSPVLVGQIDTPGNALRVSVAGPFVAVADDTAGVTIIDATDPTRPQLRHRTELGASVTAVMADGPVAYAGTILGTVAQVELATGIVLARTQVDSVRDLAWAGDHLYVLGPDALAVLSPVGGDLKVLATLPSPSRVTGSNQRLAVGGGVAYATHRNGYNTFDVTNPAAPTLIAAGSTPQFGWAQLVPAGSGLGLAVAGPNLQPGPSDDVHLYDIRDPARTDRFLTSYATPGAARAAVIAQGLAYVADGEAGLHVVNFSARDTLQVPPAITLQTSFPASGVEEARLVRVTADAHDDVQVRQVEFYVNGAAVFADGSFPFEYRFVTPRLSSARTSLTLQARVVDTGGNATWSESLIVPLLPDVTPPIVTRTLPFGGGRALRQLWVYLSEPIDPESLSDNSLRVFTAGADGALGTADDVRVAGGTRRWYADLGAAALEFDAALPNGQYRAVVTTALTDVAGNHLAADHEWQFTVADGAFWASLNSGSWHDPLNWAHGVPVDGEPVYIDVPQDVRITYASGTSTYPAVVCHNTLQLDGGQLTVNGDLQLGADLVLAGSGVPGGQAGTGATLVGATLLSVGRGNRVFLRGANTVVFDGVTLDLPMEVEPGGQAPTRLRVRNGLSLNAPITLGRSAGDYVALEFEGTQTLGGTGEVIFASQALGNTLRPLSGTLTIGPGITLHGDTGTIGDPALPLVNQGAIRADPSGSASSRGISVQGSPVQNDGTLEAVGGSLAVETVLNRGRISAGKSGAISLAGPWRNPGTITLDSGAVNLGGTFGVADVENLRGTGGHLNLTGTLESSGRALVVDGATAAWRLAGGRINGGIISAVNQGQVTAQSGTVSLLDDVVLDADIVVESGARLVGTNGMTLNGTVTLNERSGSYTALEFDGTQRLAGSGQVVLTGVNPSGMVRPNSGTLTIGPAITIHGNSGTVGNPALPLVNLGTVRSDSPGGFGYHGMLVTGSMVENAGSLAATGGAWMVAESVLNQGTVQVLEGAALRLDRAWKNPGTLAITNATAYLGGSFSTADLGVIRGANATVALVGVLENAGQTLILDGTAANWRLAGGTVNGGIVAGTEGGTLSAQAGTVSLLDGVQLDVDLTLESGARIVSTHGLTLNGVAVIAEVSGTYTALEFAGTQTLAGTGWIRFTGLNSSGTVQPTSGGLTIGPGLTVHGGSGTVGNRDLPLINQGTISADVEGRTIIIRGNPFTNQGTVRESNGGSVQVNP